MKFEGTFDIAFQYHYYEGFDECIADVAIRDKDYGIDIEIDLCQGGDGNWYGKEVARQIPTPYIALIEKALHAKVLEY